jgi:chemotaxis protein CheY-P-specific phosphatase CheC
MNPAKSATPATSPTPAGRGAPCHLDSPTLTRLVTTALERTAFVMAEPCEDDAATPPSLAGNACIATRINFSGAATGECALVASEGFVRELTAGFLGVEPEEIDLAVQGQDAMNELSNIVAGQVIRELGNATSRIFLGLPTQTQPQLLSGATPTVSCVLDSMGEHLRVSVTLQQLMAKAA